MKPAILLFCALGVTAGAELKEAHSVYLMPMNHSLDQFIASRLTRMHVLQVVTDPAKADAVITDQVGRQLQDRLDDLYPPPKAQAKEAEKEATETAKSSETNAAETAKPAEAAKPAETPAKPAASYVPPPLFGDTANKPEKPGYLSTFGHGRGTIFVVDVKSREVLWSAFERPKSSTPRELDRSAERIVKRLKDDLVPKTKQ